MIRVFESTSGVDRLHEAERFVASHPVGTEVRIVAATRGAADDFVRRLSLTRGGTFGLHRFSWGELVSHHATNELSGSGRAIASRLGIEAVAARAAFQCRDDGTLGRYEEVSAFPGFARAVGSTLLELRLAGLSPDAAPKELALLREVYEARLEDASLVDWADLVAIARDALDVPGAVPLAHTPLVLLDVPIASAAERDLLAALLGRAHSALVTLPAGDDRSWERIRELGTKKTIHADDKSSGDLARLRRHLFADSSFPQRAGDGSIELFSAPGEGRECVEMARKMRDLARDGVAFDQMAVFLRSPELYSSHLETAFRRAGIPAYFARNTKRPDPAGRAFLALLACKVERLSARRFAEYLSFGEVPELDPSGAPPNDPAPWVGPADETFGPASQVSKDANEERVQQLELFAALLAGEAEGSSRSDSSASAGSFHAADPSAPAGPSTVVDLEDGAEDDSRSYHEDPTRPLLGGTLRAPWKWEEYLVEAAVIKGRDRWARRLRGFEKEMHVKLAALRNEEAESPRIDRLRADLLRLQHFERFALPVIDDLDRLGTGTVADPSAEPAGDVPWGTWIRDLEALAPRVLRDPTHVLEILAEMRPMSEIGPVTMEEVRAVLSDRLANLERRPGPDRYGKVFVGTTESARGRTFRVVFVPGLAERLFPQRPKEDPLLLDTERRRMGPSLDTRETRAMEERLRLRTAVGAASERLVVSWPRLDVTQARPRVPSFYALDIVRAVRGILPSYEDLERAAVRARLAWPAPPRAQDAIDAVEHDLSVLGALLELPEGGKATGRARYLLELNPHLARSLRTRYARWARGKWTHWDGMVRATERTAPYLARQSLSERAYSVTALQKFAVCPYRFFLSAVHRLEPREEVSQPIQMEPLTRGSLIHETQAHTLRLLRSQGELPIQDLSGATAVLDRVLTEVAGRYEDDLAPAIDRVWEDEVAGIRADMRIWLGKLAESARDWTPELFELAFGLPTGDDFDDASVRQPVELDRKWKLHGAIDLIERSRDGERLRVTDHKTGRDLSREVVYLGGGEILQPVLYSLAAEAILGSNVERARLSFCTSRGGFRDHEVPIDDFARLYAKQLLETIDTSIRDGALPPAPREDACEWCDFRPVCGQLEETRQRRKDDTLLEGLRLVRQQP
ncbi:MAG: PD-(D/E)XK nuclease family protein [Candidatus Eisenbacteria bacterium]|uniref:PD-(D/E)XK nuclease family protein n=1 Tax=Eiseniibacteriota bacterium TaxID=2212470 RepID=A0A956N8Z2_UNCEI|nr:PD-(D/E)XK nuclease family protein [Candidatus Eisenbacteria bacterium]